MKVDNFVLLIISTVTLIVISLVTECNKGRLKELENKATNDIVESFYHMGSATPTEAGEWGYKITSLTHGKYGGRSRQDVLSNLGSHNVNDYITEDELSSYGSALSISKSGDELDGVDCLGGGASNRVDSSIWGVDCNKHVNNKLVYFYNDYKPAKYGGSVSMCSSDIFKHTDGLYYEYITDNNSGRYESECEEKLNNSSLLSISLNNDDNTLNIVEPTWTGFLDSIELSQLLFGNDDGLIENITPEKLDQLISNQIHNADSNLLNDYNHKKYYKNNKYYTLTFAIPNDLTVSGIKLILDNNGAVRFEGVKSTDRRQDQLPPTLETTPPPIITNIYKTQKAFAALDVTGKVHVWGGGYEGSYGGSLPDTLDVTNPPIITNIYSTYNAFAALDVTGKVHVWGRGDYGGSLPDTLDPATDPPKITNIYRTIYAFAALDVNRKLYVWGRDGYGGSLPDSLNTTPPPIITNIYLTGYSFTALTSDGMVVMWGHPNYDKIGENSSGEKVNVIYNVKTMSINGHTVTATHIDGSTIEWNNITYNNNTEIDEKYLTATAVSG